VIATDFDGKTIEVKPLDAPDNPYREQYAAWDAWIYQHFDPDLDPQQYGGG
jgi:hypothetical protein